MFLFIGCVIVQFSFAQKTIFDVISYIEPKGWKKEVGETITSYTYIKGNNWCRINIVKSTISKGSVVADFNSEWEEMVVKNYKTTTAPILNDVEEVNGWKIKAGGSTFKFNNSEAMVFLTTTTGYNRCASIVATTNTKAYLKDIDELLASVSLEKQESNSPQTNVSQIANSILGTWCITASDQSSFRVNNAIMSTIYRQYTFKANGMYACHIKTFDPLMSSIFLGRETGTYQINNNTLNIQPQKSVLEEWSKKNNSDAWGKLLKSQKITLEKVTYQFAKIYIPENNEWQLILKTGNETKRDGPFNNYERNAWIYILASPARPILILPGE